jgi:hypothetical protein
MKPGDRIGAVIRASEEGVLFLGYGVFEGYFMLPKNIRADGIRYVNPRLRLDNRDIVWGCECWWGSEEKMKEAEEAWVKYGWEIQIVRIKEHRRNRD